MAIEKVGRVRGLVLAIVACDLDCWAPLRTTALEVEAEAAEREGLVEEVEVLLERPEEGAAATGDLPLRWEEVDVGVAATDPNDLIVLSFLVAVTIGEGTAAGEVEIGAERSRRKPEYGSK